MQIRQAAQCDIAQLINLMEIIGYISTEKAIHRATKFVNSNPDKRLILVLEERGQLIGYVGIKKIDEDLMAEKFIQLYDYANLSWVGVQPEFRHLGNGSKLVSACDNIAINWGKKGIWLDCREKKLPFYSYNNYKIAGSFDDSRGQRFVMFKEFLLCN